MKFKVGDLVLCMESISPGVNGPRAGTMYRVISVHDEYQNPYQSIGLFIPDCTYSEAIRSGKHPNWGSTAFRLIYGSSNKPKTESDYLDKIQKNFKEGI